MDPPLGLFDKEPETNGSTKGSNGNQGETLGTSLRVDLEYKLSAGYAGNYSGIEIDFKKRLSDTFRLDAHWTIENNTSYIDWWKEGFEAQLAGQAFEQKTGNVVTGWEKYRGDGLIKNWLNTAWAPADGIRNNFNLSDGVRDYWEGSENNAVTNTAPA